MVIGDVFFKYLESLLMKCNHTVHALVKLCKLLLSRSLELSQLLLNLVDEYLVLHRKCLEFLVVALPNFGSFSRIPRHHGRRVKLTMTFKVVSGTIPDSESA